MFFVLILIGDPTHCGWRVDVYILEKRWRSKNGCIRIYVWQGSNSHPLSKADIISTPKFHIISLPRQQCRGNLTDNWYSKFHTVFEAKMLNVHNINPSIQAKVNKMLHFIVWPCFVTNLCIRPITLEIKNNQDPPNTNDTSSDIKVVIVVNIILSSIVLQVNSQLSKRLIPQFLFPSFLSPQHWFGPATQSDPLPLSK